MDKITFPKWLPPEVAERTHLILSEPLDEAIKDTIKLLAERREMKEVWEKLSKIASTPKSLAFLVDEIVNCLNHWKFLEENQLLLPPKKREERISETADAINNLRALMKKNHHLFRDDVSDVLDRAIKLAEKELHHSLFWDEIPRRMGAVTAKQTFITRILKSFMLRDFDKPLYNEIATILNIVFDNQDITAESVRMNK